MKKVFLGFLACLFFTSVTFAQDSVIGTWITDVEGREITTTYHDDGRYISLLDGVIAEGVYAIAGNIILAVIPDSGIAVGEFVIRENEMTIVRYIYYEQDGSDYTSIAQSLTPITYMRLD